ncbi:uncharacterized protein LOC132889706 [Neoarius graeffei]|uniref:uncharacterized protein LOC132889706 n=1 Tax=Neoarius graeffei TaxID=443677 RepID=UPI00298CCD64|nr:uncharacterized protein LOC132889706 [Neoarius graeffei]
MQRLCIVLCGLLASCLCSWGSRESFLVSQSPTTVELREGEPVQITCSWNITNAKVNWFKDNQRVTFNQTDKFIQTHKNNTKNSSTLIIKNADISDAGFYICEVTKDIPYLLKVNGTGTKVTSTTENDSTTQRGTQSSSTTELPITIQSPVSKLGVSVSGAAIILLICIGLSVWRMKRGCKQSERMVIREGPPSEGDEPENSEDNGSSGTSRGSTQWYMVPVYESYFDLQRCDEQQSADSGSAVGASALK